jgi:hypothetical protein
VCDPNAIRKSAAIDAIWTWNETADQVQQASHAARLRRQGIVRGVIALSVATGAHFLHWPWISWIAGAMGSLTLLSALISPVGIYARIEHVLERFASLVGDVMTWVVMVPVFYLVFFPFGLIARRGRNDLLKRFYERSASTYWTPYRQPGPPDRQF